MRLGQGLPVHHGLGLFAKRLGIELGQCKPGAENRVVGLPPLGQVAHPAARHVGVELGLSGQLIDLAGLHLGGPVRGPDVVAGLPFHLLADAGVLLVPVVVQVILAPPAFLLERHPLNRVDCVADKRLVGGFVAAGEHAVERVVVGHGNGVVLVFVAAGTADGQPHEAAGHDVDAVVNDVVRIVEKPPTQREKTHRGQRPFVGAQVQLVGSHLLNDKTVVRQVGIEGVDHIVAVGVRVGKEPRLVPGKVALGVGITRHVKPMAAPALAETR